MYLIISSFKIELNVCFAQSDLRWVSMLKSLNSPLRNFKTPGAFIELFATDSLFLSIFVLNPFKRKISLLMDLQFHPFEFRSY